MRLAVITVTEVGAVLAKQLTDSLAGEIDVFAKTGCNPFAAKEYEHLGHLVTELFHQYDAFIFVMSVGMVVRVIAPHVRDKRYDPAVVAIDENSKYAISLLSGHIGSANALTREVGGVIGAQSIITTKPDVLQRPAIDLLAVKLNAVIEPFENLSLLNAAIANGEKVHFFLDSSLVNRETYISAAEEMDIDLHDMKSLADTESYDAAVVITDKELYMVKPHLFLRPATLAVGIHCNHGTTSAEIISEVSEACKKIGRSMKSLAVISTSVINEEEIGVLAAYQQLEVPVRFLQLSSNDISEAAAIAVAKSDCILGKNQSANVSIAIAEAHACWWE